MTRPIQDRPCRQLSIAMPDELFELIDLIFHADTEFTSRADVARSLLWAGAAVALAGDPDNETAKPDPEPEPEMKWTGTLNLREPSP